MQVMVNPTQELVGVQEGLLLVLEFEIRQIGKIGSRSNAGLRDILRQELQMTQFVQLCKNLQQYVIIFDVFSLKICFKPAND